MCFFCRQNLIPERRSSNSQYRGWGGPVVLLARLTIWSWLWLSWVKPQTNWAPGGSVVFCPIGQRSLLNPSIHFSVITLPVDPLLRALLAPPPGTEEVFWMTSCLIKAPDHPSHRVTSCPASALPPADTNTRFGSGGGDLCRLPQMKEGSRIIFCLSCPYLCLALVCFKLHGRTTFQRIRVEERIEVE